MRFGREPGSQLVDAFAGLRRDGVHRARAERDRFDVVEERLHVVDEVGLRQQHDRLRAALPRHREVALEPARVEVERQRLHEERDVDVRREDLLLRDVQRLLAGDGRTPRQQRRDQVRGQVEADPVADRGQALLAHEAVRRARAQLALLVHQVVRAPVLDRDAGGDEPGGAVICERGLPAVVPAKPVQQRFRNRKSQAKLLCA